MIIQIVLGALLGLTMLAPGMALAQDSRAAVVINLADETCQVCQDSGGDGTCEVVSEIADRGIVVDKTTGDSHAPQIIKLSCQVSGLANNSGKRLGFDYSSTGTPCVVLEVGGSIFITEDWRQTLTPNGVGLLSCLWKDGLVVGE